MEVFIGDPLSAPRRVEQLLARHPDNADALLVHGMALRSQGDYARARASLEKGLNRSPSYGDIMLVLAGIAESENHPAEALACYDRYLARNGEGATSGRCGTGSRTGGPMSGRLGSMVARAGLVTFAS